MAHARKPDEELLARVTRRDDAALGELYDRFAPGLVGMLSRILRDRDAIERILQEVFQRLWGEARRLPNTSMSLGVWLTVFTRRLAVDRLRSEQKFPRLVAGGDERLGQCAVWLPGAPDIARLDERRDLLTKVVDQLPKQQRRALELAVFGGYTEKEIAEQLGEPLGRVKTEIRAAMTFLRHRLRAVSGTWAANI